ncbi:hypothetical protein WJX84_007665 [Apatococcus fuscideae]|uniref:Transmembrane protein n=1 Tax=Apatococcus fuscideae TaxID=2026836 RepID=A0AAW1SZD7_9CHLO
MADWAHNWDGNLCQCCGSRCTVAGWASCAFAYFVPCVAFGDNLKRAFSSSLWLHALLFFFCFWGIQRSFDVVFTLTSQKCPAHLPVPVDQVHAHPAVAASAHDTWLSGRKLLQLDDAPGKFTEAFADVLPSAAVAQAVVYGGADEQAQSESSTTVYSVETDTDTIELEASNSADKFDPAEGASKKHRVHKEPMPLPAHIVFMPFSPQFEHTSPGCQKAYVGLFTLYVVLVASTLFGLVYAARKRTLMRQKFSIPGSPAREVVTAAYWTEAPVTKPPKTAEMLGV